MVMKWESSAHKNPLARARGLGSAREGTGHWFNQRVTALANIPLALWLVVSVLSLAGADHATFVAWLSLPVNAVLMILTLASFFYHAALGTQVIAEDYIHDEGTKILTLISLKLGFSALFVASLFSVLKIAL
jgi:succinate dehydrogenase / fumarate reductase, membrane anchor subunit